MISCQPQAAQRTGGRGMRRSLAHSSSGICSPCGSASRPRWLAACRYRGIPGTTAFPRQLPAIRLQALEQAQHLGCWKLPLSSWEQSAVCQWCESATGTRKDSTDSADKSMAVHSFLLIVCLEALQGLPRRPSSSLSPSNLSLRLLRYLSLPALSLTPHLRQAEKLPPNTVLHSSNLPGYKKQPSPPLGSASQ